MIDKIIFYTPLIIAMVVAITTHEAAHGFVAKLFGDQTAERMGRVTFNPLKHIDPFGTIILPGLMLLTGVPFLFGYAKPVPVNFSLLNPIRLGAILVAAAGPAVNIVLACISAFFLHINWMISPFTQKILTTSITINVVLAVFNMLPILPLDGGRVLTFMLPVSWARFYARTERYGMLILLGLIALPSLLKTISGYSVDPLRIIMMPLIGNMVDFILTLTGHG